MIQETRFRSTHSWFKSQCATPKRKAQKLKWTEQNNINMNRKKAIERNRSLNHQRIDTDVNNWKQYRIEKETQNDENTDPTQTPTEREINTQTSLIITQEDTETAEGIITKIDRIFYKIRVIFEGSQL